MRNSLAPWKSRSVSSGSRRSSSHFAARSFRTGSSASAFSQVPVKDLFSGPQRHARPLADVLVKPLEIGYAVRHAADIRMHADRHHARRLLAVGIKPVE